FGLEGGVFRVGWTFPGLFFLPRGPGAAYRFGGHLGLVFSFPAGEPFPEALESLAPLVRRARPLQPVVEVLDGRAMGLRPPLQISEARPDRIRCLGDRLDPCVEPLDLSVRLIVDEEVRPDRDERLVDVLRLGDQERIRADRYEDFGGLPGFLIPHERLAGPHVLLEGVADDLLLLGQRLDLRPVLIEDRDPPSEFGLAGAHARASSAYRTA